MFENTSRGTKVKIQNLHQKELTSIQSFCKYTFIILFTLVFSITTDKKRKQIQLEIFIKTCVRKVIINLSFL